MARDQRDNLPIDFYENSMMSGSYREAFQDSTRATAYEEGLFSADSYAALLWTVERDFLQRFVARFAASITGVDYLDFACGTGRVLSFMEGLVDTARGIEIAAPMLEFARAKVKRAELVQADITAPGTEIEGQYDLITSFRFFLNAEPALRLAVMRGLAARLRNDSSRLIFNIQASTPGHKSLVRVVRRSEGGRDGSPGYNVMSQRAVERLVQEAGLNIEEQYGYDLISGAGLRVLAADRLLAVERRLAGGRMANAIGGHQLYVVRRNR